MNIVIIVGKKDSTMSAIKLVKELDKEIQQVRITSQILDVTVISLKPWALIGYIIM